MRGKDTKMFKIKKAIAMLLPLIMVFAFSASAFALENDTVEIYINGTLEETVTISGTTTVYDVVEANTNATWTNPSPAVEEYSPLYDEDSPLYGLYNQQIVYLKSLNSISSAPYVPLPGSLDEDDNYIPGIDPVLDAADEALSEYGGLEYWYGEGYGFAADWEHMVYIGNDWVYTVNGETPGKDLEETVPIYGDFFMYTMRECPLEDGDSIELNYKSFFEIF
jgi:hypothetical protein